MAFHPAPFRSSSESRTTRHVSFYKCLGQTSTRCFRRCTGCLLSSASITSWPCCVQDSADVISTVSEPAHLVAHQRMQHSIVVRPTVVRAISTNIICQTIVQHCRTSDLELTSTCCVKLRLSLLSNPNLKLISFLLLSAKYSTCLFRQRLCSRLTALWCYINLVLLLLWGNVQGEFV